GPNAGTDTQDGERGIKLRGGQQQRTGIAGAFLKDPEIFMLGEATASLGSRSERLVRGARDELMDGSTVRVSAHSLSRISNSDNIFFIENGHLTGSCTHAELMDSHTMYKTFTDQQFTQDKR